MNNQKGFTLIELMIVIAIIAILAAIALPAYQNYVAKSQVTEAISLASSLKTPVSLYITEEGSCPDKPTTTTPSEDNLGQFVKTLDVKTESNNCVITATMDSTSVNPKVRGGKIILTTIMPKTPTGESTTVSTDLISTEVTKWSCTAEGIPTSMLPKSCKA